MRQALRFTEVGAVDCWSAATRARRYDREVNRVFYAKTLRRLLQHAPELGGRGLDLGCGTGFSTEALLADVPSVDWQGVDASAAMLALAGRKLALATTDFVQASAHALPFPDASFDVVVANFAWHWFAAGAGLEVSRVLRPGGWLLATVPLRQPSSASGNRLLARALLVGRRSFVLRSSQGLQLADVRQLLPPPARLARAEVVIERERFAGGAALLDVLDSRGALAAIFGEEPPATIEAPDAVDFEWPFAVVHVQVGATLHATRRRHTGSARNGTARPPRRSPR